MLKSFSIWRMYFWVAITGFAVGIPNLGPITNWVFATWFLVTTEVISLIGLYAYAFKTPIFSSRFWRVFFWLILFAWNLPILYSLSPFKDKISPPAFLENYLLISSGFFTSQMIMLLTLGLVLGTPIFYAIYKEGYRRNR